jgi:hypothetical protein
VHALPPPQRFASLNLPRSHSTASSSAFADGRCVGAASLRERRGPLAVVVWNVFVFFKVGHPFPFVMVAPRAFLVQRVSGVVTLPDKDVLTLCGLVAIMRLQLAKLAAAGAMQYIMALRHHHRDADHAFTQQHTTVHADSACTFTQQHTTVHVSALLMTQ